MSALSTENANLTRQRFYQASSALGGTLTRSALVFYALKALFLHLATNKGNPDLQLKYVTDGANNAIVGEACHLYAVVIKKGTDATASYFKVSNHATQVQADSDIILKSAVAGEEIVLLYPDGLAFATGITAGSYTAYNGSNATTPSTATHNFYGYLVVAA